MTDHKLGYKDVQRLNELFDIVAKPEMWEMKDSHSIGIDDIVTLRKMTEDIVDYDYKLILRDDEGRLAAEMEGGKGWMTLVCNFADFGRSFKEVVEKENPEPRKRDSGCIEQSRGRWSIC